jgi:hypothetical protein|tara:strand:- start:6364 stop:6699 length:336 start_codon:yes stop_codon:yes gene_type:complete
MTPTIVYKSPGTQHGPGTTTYSWLGVKTQEELDEKLLDGWHMTLGEAIAPKIVFDKTIDDEAVDNAPVTRSEVVNKAKDLGLQFDVRTPSTTLLKRIEEAINNGMEQTPVH